MPKDVFILRNSKVPKELIATAVEFAASEHSSDHITLISALNSQDFLGRLNTQHEYDTLSTKQLKVAKVIKVLRDSPHAAAKQTLTRLAEGGPFIDDNWRRQELLVRALVGVRPATPAAVAYWHAQSKPTAVNRHITIDMLCENGTPPALELLEKKLSDPAQEKVHRVSWIHAFMLGHRNETPMLQACERMITQSLPTELRPVLLETLCSYDARWYPCCYRPNPPSRFLITAEGKPILRRICRYAKASMELTPALKLAVERTLLEIGDTD